MEKLKCLFILLILTLSTAAFGQNVSGKVTDDKGEPITGVSVVVKGQSNGTMTDDKGNYTLSKVNSSATVVYSFIGMVTKELAVAGRSTINVTLSDDSKSLNEVMVIGYGVVKKSDATGAVAAIKSDDFNKGIVTTPDQLLNGHIAGVQVGADNGQPGGGTSVRIRGINSLGASSDPLYVIDGVPIDNSRSTTSVGGDVAMSNTTMNPLSMIAASDIESMTVLKDASATAIYGSRGANGVIMITTKGGKEGKTTLSYSGSAGFSTVSKKLELLSADQYRSYVSGAGTANTDWQDAIFRTAFVQNHNLSLSGGNQTTSYRASLGASQQEGIVLNTGLNRYTAKANINHKMFNERLILKGDITFSSYKFDNFMEQQTSGADGGVIDNALKSDPTQPIYNADGTFHESGAISVRNPVAIAKQNKDVTNGDRFIGSLDATLFLIPKELSFKTNIAYDVDNSLRKAYQPINSSIGKDVSGRALVENNKYSNRLLETYLTYNKSINENNILNIVGGYSWQVFDNYHQYTVGTGFSNDLGADNIGGASSKVTDNLHERNALISYYGRINYNLYNKYLFTATVRTDGSSKFDEGKKWATFPSAALAWKVSQEDFMKNVSFVNDLKLRIGYGTTGNQGIGNFLYLSNYDVNSNAGTYFGGKFIVPYNVKNIANKNLQWEQTSQFNVGTDFSLFNSVLRGTIDYYSKNTTKMLLNIDAVQPAVASTYIDNIGAMTNKGVELSLDAAILNKGDLKWNSNFNIAYNKNKITKLYNDKDIIYGIVSGAGATGNTQILRVGESMGSFYVQQYTGIVNGKETFASADYQIYGKALPDYILGFTNAFSYKDWDFSFVFRSQLGAKVYNNTRAEMSNGNRLPGQNTTLEGAEFHKAGGGGIVYQSSRWVENASFLRLDNMTLGYNFKVFPSVVKSAKIYATAQNLFVLTKYKGYDPEVNNTAGNKGANSVGIDYNTYPHARTITVGLNINF